MITAETDGIKMNYVKFGTGKKIFVMLPGISIKSVMLSEIAIINAYSLFADDYTVYLFDRRLDIPDDYSVKMMADDTAAVMKYLGLSNVYLFGASQGGMISLCLAYYYPDLVKCMVLGSAAYKVDSDCIVNYWPEISEESDIMSFLNSLIVSIYSEKTVSSYGTDIINSMLPVTDEEILRFRICAAAVCDFDFTDKLQNVKCPVLAVASDGDKIFNSVQSVYIAEKTSGRFFIYDKSFGHAVYDEAPDYKEKIKNFFAEY